jgi:hypothetical protein
MDGALFPSRMAALPLGVLGAMGAILSVTGIFGLAAYSVSKLGLVATWIPAQRALSIDAAILLREE